MIKSDHFHYDPAGKNITLEQLQADLVASLNVLASPNYHKDGHSVHVITAKGDWKYNHEFLQCPRFYGKAGNRDQGMCMRCFATRDTWLDVDEKFNCPEDIRRARATAVGPSVPIRGLLGWVPEMHVPDLLHTVFLGTGRDLVGSLCMEVIHEAGFLGSTYNERLASLRQRIQSWCVEHGLRPSTIEELRF